MIHTLIQLLNLVSAAIAFKAASLWWEASKVKIHAPSPGTLPALLNVSPYQLADVVAASEESARLNAKAAGWTGLSAFLQTTALVLGAFW